MANNKLQVRCRVKMNKTKHKQPAEQRPSGGRPRGRAERPSGGKSGVAPGVDGLDQTALKVGGEGGAALVVDGEGPLWRSTPQAQEAESLEIS